jgi:hypothetical protein
MKLELYEVAGITAFPTAFPLCDGQPTREFVSYIVDMDQVKDGFSMNEKYVYAFTPPTVPGKFEEIQAPVYGTSGGLTSQTVSVQLPVVDKEAFPAAVEAAKAAFAAKLAGQA